MYMWIDESGKYDPVGGLDPLILSAQHFLDSGDPSIIDTYLGIGYLTVNECLSFEDKIETYDLTSLLHPLLETSRRISLPGSSLF